MARKHACAEDTFGCSGHDNTLSGLSQGFDDGLGCNLKTL